MTRQVGVRRIGEAAFEEFKVYLNALLHPGLLFTLVVMFALKGDLNRGAAVRRGRDGRADDALLRRMFLAVYCSARASD